MKYENNILVVISLVMAMIGTILMIHNNDAILVDKQVQESLARETLRFHVLANSDSEEDQSLKMQVKEGIITYLSENMNEAADLQETKQWVGEHMSEITQVGQEIVLGQGYTYEVRVELTTTDFPKKTYGDIYFPAGEYEALKVYIGDAGGENWWCCLYPKLCFIDATYGVVSEEGKEDLQGVLTDEEYDTITTATEFKIKWFFFQ